MSSIRGLRYLAIIVGFCSALLAGSAGLAFAQATPPQIIVFGDSISDPGNGFTGVKANATPPDYGGDPLLIPNAPYARGGHHLTNGETWIEQLGKLLGVQRSVLPAFASANPFAMNFAIGTARARQILPPESAPPSLAFEVAAFLQKTGGQAPSDALYVIEIGGIDVRDAVATGDPVQGLAILQAAATAIHDNINLLYSLGARHFLVWNVPNAGFTPAAHLAGPAAVAGATLATTTFKQLLGAELAPLVAAGIVIPFDANDLVTKIVSAPQDYGLTNVTDACVTPNDPPFICATPDEYLFWDGVHPTTAVHGIVAQAVLALLTQ
jgi:phospholipase/lecithinase/hemolysin